MSGGLPRVTFDGGGEVVYISYIHLLSDIYLDFIFLKTGGYIPYIYLWGAIYI